MTLAFKQYLSPWLAAADGGVHDPVDHVLPHALHSEPILRFPVPGISGDVPFLHIYEGQYSFYVTNHMLMTLVSAVVMTLTFLYASRRIQPSGDSIAGVETRGRFAQFLEAICAFVRDEVARPSLGGLTDKYIAYIWTIFFFVLFCNVLGLLPIGYVLQLLTGNVEYSHWGGTATSNLALNGVLAITSFLAILFIGIREVGAKAFFAHFNPIGWEAKMLPLAIGLYMLEWMGLIIKCTVLAMRLFGTMMAGHLVIAAFVLLIFSAAQANSTLGYGVGVAVVVGGALLTLLELFICCLQAFIFTFLTVLFISAGAVPHHSDDHHHDGHEGEADAATGRVSHVV